MRDNLKEALSVAQKAEGTNPALPILRNCLIEADARGVRVAATNLDFAISRVLTGKVIEQGRCTVPMRLFLDILGAIKSERLNIEKKDSVCIIKTDNYEARVQGIPTEDFPPIPKIEKREEYIEINGEIFLSAIEQVVASTHISELRPELNSALMQFSMDAIKLVATDSFRLSEKTIFQNQFTSTHARAFSLLLPLKTAGALLSTIKKGETVRVYHDETQVLFTAGNTELLSRLSEGTFPNYAAILPKKFNAEVFVDKEEFLSAVRAAGVFGGKNNEAKFRIHENKKLLEVLSSDQGLGENKYLLPARVKGDTDEIVFNWRYILDALKVTQDGEISLGINGESEPSQIKSTSDPSYFYVLKPIASS